MLKENLWDEERKARNATTALPVDISRRERIHPS